MFLFLYIIYFFSFSVRVSVLLLHLFRSSIPFAAFVVVAVVVVDRVSLMMDCVAF